MFCEVSLHSSAHKNASVASIVSDVRHLAFEGVAHIYSYTNIQESPHLKKAVHSILHITSISYLLICIHVEILSLSCVQGVSFSFTTLKIGVPGKHS